MIRTERIVKEMRGCGDRYCVIGWMVFRYSKGFLFSVRTFFLSFNLYKNLYFEASIASLHG